MKNTRCRMLRYLAALLSLFLLTALWACGRGGVTSEPGGGLVVVDGTASSSASVTDGSAGQTPSGEEESHNASDFRESSAAEGFEGDMDSSSPEGFGGGGDAASTRGGDKSDSASARAVRVREDGWYSSKEEVAAYIHLYGHLPENYITKTQAKKLGWDSSARDLWRVAPGKSIGGGPFGNYEGILPDGDYRECDIDFNGKKRNAKRIVYSDDGRIYYTDDHYETFERLY